MIKVLSKETIDQIAAGEVVERPLSVVKELVENSVDAKSTAITVETKNGGTSLIRVTDNGIGIKSDECHIAFMRHATSKINNSNDLYSINTLGFRGEALASISAVSNVELITKTSDEIMAKRVLMSASEIISTEDIAAPEGTTFFIRDLFYNTPARLKFLKSFSSENAAIEDTMTKLSLSRPDISFRYICDGKERLFTSGSNNLKNTIFELMGLNTANALLKIHDENQYFSLSGFIGTQALSKGNRSGEHFFVNKRYIKSNILQEAVEKGYFGYLMQHQFPFCVLFIDINPEKIDVNVHPTKMEVRFDDPYNISEILSTQISKCLKNREDIERIPLNNNVLKDEKPISYEPFEVNFAKSVFVSDRAKEEEQDTDVFEDIPQSINNIDIPENNNDTYIQESFDFLSASAIKNHNIIGQVFDTYWLVEYNKKLYIIDQHAAHEKVLFERTMKFINESKVHSQLLTVPINVTLSANEENVLINNKDAIEKIGIFVEHFGDRDYKITSIPATYPNVNPKELLIEILDSGLSFEKKQIIERVASISCKAAVKGNHNMSRDEVKALIEELLELDNPYHCPHGRPTMISFTQSELDKKFKRII